MSAHPEPASRGSARFQRLLTDPASYSDGFADRLKKLDKSIKKKEKEEERGGKEISPGAEEV